MEYEKKLRAFPSLLERKVDVFKEFKLCFKWLIGVFKSVGYCLYPLRRERSLRRLIYKQ